MKTLKIKLYNAFLRLRDYEYTLVYDILARYTVDNETLMRWLNAKYTTLYDISDDGHYLDEHTGGNCVEVTLERDGVFVTCNGIVLWDDEGQGDGGEIIEETFDEWLGYANAGKEGFTVTTN